MASIALRLARLARRYAQNEQIGFVQDFALATPPPGWLWCNGAVLLANTPHPILRQRLIDDGFPYGQDGNGNLFLPDARGRASAGRDNMGGTAAGRLTTAGAGINGAALGASGGAQTHTLSIAQMPAHNHGVNDPGHVHSYSGVGIYGPSSPAASNTVSTPFTQNTATAWTGISIQNNGSGQAHNNVQPTIVFNKIIFAGD